MAATCSPAQKVAAEYGAMKGKGKPRKGKMTIGEMMGAKRKRDDGDGE